MALRFPRLRINRTWLMLGIAILLGLVATWLTIQYLKVREARIQAELASRASGGPTVRVVVPIRDLPKGTRLDGSMVAGRPVLSDLVYPESITPDEFDKFQGARLLRNVLRGRPLLKTDLEGAEKDFSDLLEPGRRAITINVDDLNSISQMVRPGNLVDLFLILPDLSDPSGNSQQVVLLLQRLKVIATGQNFGRGTPADEVPGAPPGATARYTTFTFEVTPEQAARIALAQQLGTFRAVLRPEPDEETVRIGRINTKNLLRKIYIAETPEEDERDTSAVEYIIGGQGSGGVGNTITVNVPGLGPISTPVPQGAPGGAAAPASPAQAAAAAVPQIVQQYLPQPAGKPAAAR